MKLEKEIQEYVRSFAGLSKQSVKERDILHGTTILALKYKNGVVVAGDCRMCFNPTLIGSENFKKLFKIDEDSVIAVAGSVAPAMELIRFLRAEVDIYNRTQTHRLSFEGKANLVSRILAKFAPLASAGIVVLPIYASRNKIYGYDYLGARYEVKYLAVGSGSQQALTYLDSNWNEELSKFQAVKIAVAALNLAYQRNPQTGKVKLVYICLLYTSPSPRDISGSRMPSSA